MNKQTLLERITVNLQILDGKPAIQECLTVEHILELLAEGETFETLLESYPWLEREDIQACLLYARQLVLQEQSNSAHLQPKTVDDLIAEIPKILEQVPYLRLLVLFGSRARGDYHEKSDWDFAFSCDEELRKQYEKGSWDVYRIWVILQKKYRLGNDQIDVVELKDCSDILAHYIAQDGHVIYERNPGEFEDFRQKRLMSPAQMKQLRKEMRERLKEKLQKLKR